MPFDNLTAARPYMREMTTALAALVATAPDDDVLRAIAAELAFRSRPAALRLMDEVTARLGARGAGFQVPITPGEPIGATDRCYPGWHQPSTIIPCVHGEVVPEAREEVVSVVHVTAPEPMAVVADPPAKPATARKGKAAKPTRDENQAARKAHFALLFSAHKAADAECGRDSCGQSVWAGVPGAAHIVRVPEALGWYITLDGKAQKENRVRVYPAPRFWPGGSLPDGYEDMGEHTPLVAFKAQPGSDKWLRWVKAQAKCMIKGENDTMAGRTYSAMHAKQKTARAA